MDSCFHPHVCIKCVRLVPFEPLGRIITEQDVIPWVTPLELVMLEECKGLTLYSKRYYLDPPKQ